MVISSFRRLTAFLSRSGAQAAPAPAREEVCGVEVTRETVLRKSQELWPHGEAGEVLAELADIPESLRTQLAVLWRSQGSLEDLKRWAGIARKDRRDVLMSAEYPPEEWNRTPEVEMQLGRIRGEHLRRYRAWLRR
jgi:hypothetical protein